jgi:hypothetical protein
MIILLIVVAVWTSGLGDAKPADAQPSPTPKAIQSPIGTPISVVTSPPRASIAAGGYHAVKFTFTAPKDKAVTISAEDTEFLTLSGETVFTKCVACRILGGAFTIPAGKSYVFTDNIFVMPELAANAGKKGAAAAEWRITFRGVDDRGASVTAPTRLVVDLVSP